MAQDTALLRYLLKGARRAPGSGSQRDLAFAFDGTNGYISSNATIGRTGYDMNVSGNVSTGSDADGSYIQFNGNYRRDLATGTQGNVTSSGTIAINQTASFTMSVKFKFISFSTDNNSSGVFSLSGSSVGIYTNNNTGSAFTFRIRNGASFTDATTSISTGTLYQGYLVYDQPSNKLYAYISTSGGSSTLINAGGTIVSPATFGGSVNTQAGDIAVAGGNPTSSNKYIYHAAIRNKALTQAEINADIALGNTAKNDPSIVAYYIPDNLQYNTQYASNPKDISNATWTKDAGITVTANTTIAPDGTTTADTVAIVGAANTGFRYINTGIAGSTIASKTFIVKAFVKVAAATAPFRLECTHGGVTAYRSTNQTATTDRQEFTFTQTFTSSTAGTSTQVGLCNDTVGTSVTLLVRNVRLFLVNETLRDESPNIGGFIGWKQNRVISCWLKPGVDGTGTFNSQPFFTLPYIYGYIRESTNSVRVRYSDRMGNNETSYTLGSGFRSKVHVCAVPYFTGTIRAMKLYINGVLQNTGSYNLIPCNSILQTNLTVGRYFTPTYFSGNIRDARIYTFTGSFTDADALAIYNGGEPTSSGVTKYLHYRPPVGEVGTTTQDQSTNDRDGTLNNGVTRDYI